MNLLQISPPTYKAIGNILFHFVETKKPEYRRATIVEARSSAREIERNGRKKKKI